MAKGNKGKNKRVKLLPLILIIILCVAMVVPMLLMGGCGQKESKVTLYITRHGQTTDNVKEVLSGSKGNALLTEEGREQAKALGEGISDIIFEKAYSSELSRAKETLSLALSENREWAASKKEPGVLSGLNDIDLGEAEGMSAEAAAERFGDIFGSPTDQSFVSPCNGETRYEFLKRFDETIGKIVKDNQVQNKNVMIACHSSADWWLESKFPDTCGKGLQNAKLTKIEYSNGKWELLMYNGGEVK